MKRRLVWSLAMVCAAFCLVPVCDKIMAAGQPGPRVLLFIAEQNIEGPQAAWWASEVDLSVTESQIAQRLLEAGFTVLEPSALTEVIKKEKAFRTLNLSDRESLKIAQLSRADYVVLGKAVASAGGRVPQSSMRSCYANITVRLFQVNTGAVVAYLDASGTAAHPDVITGGREALVQAAAHLSQKLVEALAKQAPAQSAACPAADASEQIIAVPK